MKASPFNMILFFLLSVLSSSEARKSCRTDKTHMPSHCDFNRSLHLDLYCSRPDRRARNGEYLKWRRVDFGGMRVWPTDRVGFTCNNCKFPQDLTSFVYNRECRGLGWS